MRLLCLLPALFGAVALCLPANTLSLGDGNGLSSRNEDNANDTTASSSFSDDGIGCKVWRSQHRQGDIAAKDTLELASGNCFDLSQLYGNWDDQVRSLSVNAGHQCKFYTKNLCPDSNKEGKVLVLGDKNKCVERDTLDKNFDRKIKSVRCKEI